ncbi:hypothetical protein DL768_007341 [Monosporascus sp. mg162]|nr:hypothetical protein DL768_007341 [Monosporascus sp. mg162]
MATEWNAVSLLDEADVFMAERNPYNIASSELVSTFLRELEHTLSIIFLTTNMYPTIDKAFRARVSPHPLLEYLTSDARAFIWPKFLDRSPGKRSVPAIEESSKPGAAEGNLTHSTLPIW